MKSLTSLGITEEIYLGDFPSREALEQATEFWDNSSAYPYALCPRAGYYSGERKLSSKGEALQLIAGSAIHAGLDILYVTDDEEMALEATLLAFGDREPPAPSHNYAHLHAGHVEGVFKNYLVWRRKHDTGFTPLVVSLDDLDLTQVVAAIWRVTPDGKIILGESKLVMRFEVEGEEFIYSGKPDLPIENGGRLYLRDFKSTSGNLGEWYFGKHKFSNQLRGYCRMLSALLGETVAGAFITGIYVGADALQTKTKSGAPSKRTKFDHYGPLLYRPSHHAEAIHNQWAWMKAREFYRQFGYWPQHTGKVCQGCDFASLCEAAPAAREAIIQRDFVQRRTEFLNL